MARLIPPVIAAGTLNSGPVPTIRVDDELRLRAWGHNDLEVVVRAFSDPDIQHFHFRRYDNVAAAQEWLDVVNEGWATETTANWAVIDRADRVLGRVGLHMHLGDGWAEIAYWVLPADRGKGVAARATVALTAWAHELGFHRIELQHSEHNLRSRAVAEKAGYQLEGVRRGANLHSDGWHDMVLYSHLSTDLRNSSG